MPSDEDAEMLMSAWPKPEEVKLCSSLRLASVRPCLYHPPLQGVSPSARACFSASPRASAPLYLVSSSCLLMIEISPIISPLLRHKSLNASPFSHHDTPQDLSLFIPQFGSPHVSLTVFPPLRSSARVQSLLPHASSTGFLHCPLVFRSVGL